MGAGGAGGGDKRSVNSELNLVPYIDLLSVLICFLLISAVWNQIAALSTNASNTTAGESATPPDPNKVDLSVSVYLDRIETLAGKDKITLPHVAGNPDYARLSQVFASWKQRWPDRKDVTLNTHSQAPYKHLISVMDTLVESEFEDIGVNTN